MDRKAEQGAPTARTTLIIDRSKWLRGEGDDDSKLIRERDGKMCCLGFFGLACGASERDLLNEGRPDETKARFVAWPSWLLERRLLTDDCRELMWVNDDMRLAPDDREKRIAAVFALHGVDVRFVDGASNG